MLKLFKKIIARSKLSARCRSGEIAQLTKNNTAEAYDKLWGDQELLKHYMEPARIKAFREVLRFILKQDYGARVVELGFGSGNFLKMLVDENRQNKLEVYGLDYAESGVERARNLIPEGKFVHGDIYALPYESNYFDQVYCLQTLEHLHAPEKALLEMDRICKPDGLILLTVPNGDLDDFEGHVQFWNESAFKEFIEPRELLYFMMLNQERAMMIAFKPYKDLQR